MFDHSRINNDVTMLGSDEEDDQPDNRSRRRQTQRTNHDLDADSDHYQAQQNSNVEEQEDDSDEEERPTVPSDLVTRLLYEFFESDKTKITKDANEAVARYVDIFVREAIARSVVEREGGNGTTTAGGEFLEVEDLEKVVPQLLLDL